VQSVATGQSTCAGPACGESVSMPNGGTADGGGCPAGESCRPRPARRSATSRR
jgi:hypothetical protein